MDGRRGAGIYDFLPNLAKGTKAEKVLLHGACRSKLIIVYHRV